MPDILYGKGSFRRDNGAFAELKLVNMFAEAVPTVENGVAILSRPGLASIATRGNGPIRAIYQRPGLFGGDVFTLSATTLYRNATSLGVINGSGPVRIAASNAELVITRGQTAYSYNGTNLQAIAFPDSANVTAVTGAIGGMFIFARSGTHAFYWSEVNNGRTVGALSFASAESMPDDLRDVVAIGDNLFLLGEESLEVHYLTTNALLPFSRISQRTVGKGVIATGCAIEFDNALHFIGNDFIVYRMADVPQRISDHGLEERISESTTWSLFEFSYQGHSFLCVRLDSGTWAFDPASQQWTEFQTWGQTNWLAQCAVTLESGTQFGSALDGKILEFDGWLDDGDPMVRQFTAAFPIKGGTVPVDMLEVETNAGATMETTGAGSTPLLEMRFSRDGGRTFSTWRTAQLGAMGEYRKRPRYRRCGMFDAPGAVFDFRLADPAPLRVSTVLINESAAGRSR